MEKSLAMLEEYIAEHGPFDGLLGFSQGGVLASFLLAAQHRGQALQQHPPFRVAILIASMSNRSAPHFHDIPIPTVHVVGDTDPLDPRIVTMTEKWRNPVVIRHEGGHKVPNLNAEQLATLRSVLVAAQATAHDVASL